MESEGGRDPPASKADVDGASVEAQAARARGMGIMLGATVTQGAAWPCRLGVLICDKGVEGLVTRSTQLHPEAFGQEWPVVLSQGRPCSLHHEGHWLLCAVLGARPGKAGLGCRW